MGPHGTKIDTDWKWPQFLSSKNDICSQEINFASKCKKTWIVIFDNWMLHLPQFKNFQFWGQFLHNQPKSAYFLPHVSIFIMTQFPNSDFGLIWLKSFLFTSRMEREREKMDVNRYLKKYSRNKICYYCYCKTKIGCVVSLPIVPVIVVKIANLLLRIFRQISIDVHFFLFLFSFY